MRSLCATAKLCKRVSAVGSLILALFISRAFLAAQFVVVGSSNSRVTAQFASALLVLTFPSFNLVNMSVMVPAGTAMGQECKHCRLFCLVDGVKHATCVASKNRNGAVKAGDLGAQVSWAAFKKGKKSGARVWDGFQQAKPASVGPGEAPGAPAPKSRQRKNPTGSYPALPSAPVAPVPAKRPRGAKAWRGGGGGAGASDGSDGSGDSGGSGCSSDEDGGGRRGVSGNKASAKRARSTLVDPEEWEYTESALPVESGYTLCSRLDMRKGWLGLAELVESVAALPAPITDVGLLNNRRVLAAINVEILRRAGNPEGGAL